MLKFKYLDFFYKIIGYDYLNKLFKFKVNGKG